MITNQHAEPRSSAFAAADVEAKLVPFPDVDRARPLFPSIQGVDPMLSCPCYSLHHHYAPPHISSWENGRRALDPLIQSIPRTRPTTDTVRPSQPLGVVIWRGKPWVGLRIKGETDLCQTHMANQSIDRSVWAFQKVTGGCKCDNPSIDPCLLLLTPTGPPDEWPR